MDIRIVPRAYSVLLYEKRGSMNYTGSFQVFKLGDRGIIHSLQADEFYRVVKECPQIFDDLDVSSLEGPVKDAHAVLIKKVLRDKVVITDRGRCTVEGMDMRWIVVKLDGRQIQRDGPLVIEDDEA